MREAWQSLKAVLFRRTFATVLSIAGLPATASCNLPAPGWRRKTMTFHSCELGAVIAPHLIAAFDGLSSRDRQIVADFFGPRSEKDVAERNGCAERTVRRIWQRAKAAGLLP